jgi:hypothetical protein
MAGSGSTETHAAVPTNADKTNAILGLGNKLDTTYATDAQLAAAVAANAADVVAALQVTSLDGVDETGTPGDEVYDLTGMTATSVVSAVAHVSTKASVATIALLDPADFTPGADTLTSDDATDRSSDQLLVFWFNV